MINTVILLPNPEIPEACVLAKDVGYWLVGKGIQIRCPMDPKMPKDPQFIPIDVNRTEELIDLAITFGGDGTVLWWADCFEEHIPVLAINFGHYGFITDIEPEDAFPAIEQALQGECPSYLRNKVLAEYYLDSVLALNEICLRLAPEQRLKPILVKVDTYIIGEIHANEILVSTPTGSTGYSLSAGGPIVHPDVECLIITPVCPHTLNSRPIVVPSSASIFLTPRGDMTAFADNRYFTDVKANETLKLTFSDSYMETLRADGDNFYTKLDKRMHWGERF